MKPKESEKTCGNCQHWIPNGGKLGFGYCAANGMGYRRPDQSCKTRFESIESERHGTKTIKAQMLRV